MLTKTMSYAILLVGLRKGGKIIMILSKEQIAELSENTRSDLLEVLWIMLSIIRDSMIHPYGWIRGLILLRIRI